MKQITLFTTLLFMVSYYAQGQGYNYKTIMENQQFELHSGSNAMLFNGASRAYVPIATTGLDYIIYTVGANTKQNVSHQAMEVVALSIKVEMIMNGMGAFASVTNVIKDIDIPQSNAEIDVYVLGDVDNLNWFMQKKDEIWRFYQDYSCVSSLGCKREIDVRGMQGRTLYLGLRNPAKVNSIVATVNAIGIQKK